MSVWRKVSVSLRRGVILVTEKRLDVVQRHPVLHQPRRSGVPHDALPDALDLLARYAPIVTASELAAAISDIRSMEPFGIITDILAAAEVNEGAVREQIQSERRERAERRQAAREARDQS